jgi:inhibitor of KinA sporulation pathway (predicted exonuclease)
MLLVIDLEATCDEGGQIPPESMEIIEVGAVWAELDGLVIDRFQAIVRPVMNPQLTNYCKDLIGITQAEVDAACTWPLIAKQLRTFAELHMSTHQTWGSWGKYDYKQIGRDCVRHSVPGPLENFEHINLKRQFAKVRKIKEVGMLKALEMTGQKLEGAHHRGLDDAVNIAKLLPWCDPRNVIIQSHE